VAPPISGEGVFKRLIALESSEWAGGDIEPCWTTMARMF
jgi:hypothetical protein